jgi:3-phenylpropionate/trans-cinnamate dioxygenase ferredoxin subunit
MPDFTAIGKLADFPSGRILEFTVGGRPICAVRMGERVHAFGRFCTHEFVELTYGYVLENRVHCAQHGAASQHGAAFNLDDGEPEIGPTDMALAIYTTRIEGDDVLVSLDPSIR